MRGWELWTRLGSPRYVAAPMVDQSELPFRLLARTLGTDLAYTPMMHARLMAECDAYRASVFDPHPDDRPLIGQLAGHDPAVLIEAARHVQGPVDAVDLNFGCPQGIARRGRYGAFLLEEPDLAVKLVGSLADALDVPVTAKVRLLPSLSESVALCRRLVDAGASVLCVHGRTRLQNKQTAGSADWGGIRTIVEAIGADVPVIANGGIGDAIDVKACLAATGAAAVMSSEALLENPALFCANRHPVTGDYLDQRTMARMYLDMCERYGVASHGHVRGHLFKMCHGSLRVHPRARDALCASYKLEDYANVLTLIDELGWAEPNFHSERVERSASWYWRHRPMEHGASDEGSEKVGDSGVEEQPTREKVAEAALLRRSRKQQLRRQRRAVRNAAKKATTAQRAATAAPRVSASSMLAAQVQL